ncbi:MAG: hypothetical protein AB1Z98_08685 [Nannocystaceae bacterium]
MTSLRWGSLAGLGLPLLVACPASPIVDDDGTPTSSTGLPGDGSTTRLPGDGSTNAMPQTDGSDGTTTQAVDGTSSSSTTNDPSTDDGSPPVCVCGNNELEPECGEVCDLAQLSGETCVSLGFQGGQLGCLLTCDDYNLLGCFICGNDVVDIAEDCESVVPEGVTCESMGFEGGQIACGDDCLYDTSDCSICGDGVRQGLEQCDGIDLGGETCNSIGFDMGPLGCDGASCAFDVTACEGGQYFQDFEAGVLPPEFTVGGTVGWVVDAVNPIAGGFSAHNGNIGASQNSTMALTAIFGAAGTISFTHEESSEGSFDFLEFYIDGVLIDSWSGINPPVVENYPVGAGMHDFELRYDKDGSVDAGMDTVWIDDLSLVPGVPI